MSGEKGREDPIKDLATVIQATKHFGKSSADSKEVVSDTKTNCSLLRLRSLTG